MDVLFAGGLETDEANNAPILNVMTERGYTPRFVPFDWREEATLENWVAQLKAAYSQHNPRQTILAGFSFGAVASLAVAESKNPAQLWLFSLSAVFPPDDLASWPANHPQLPTPQQVAVFNRLDFDRLTAAICCPTLLFLGGNENFATLPQRVRAAHKQIRGSRLIIARGAGHNPNKPAYLKAIRQAI